MLMSVLFSCQVIHSLFSENMGTINEWAGSHTRAAHMLCAEYQLHAVVEEETETISKSIVVRLMSVVLFRLCGYEFNLIK